MKEPLFFHIRSKEVLPHTYCIRSNGNTLFVGYAITHKNDKFCKKTGRDLAEKKVKILMSIKNENFRSSAENLLVPDSVGLTLEPVIKRSKELLRIEGPVVLKTFFSENRTKIPYSQVYNF
jgi:hypothetical protein